MEKLIFLWRSLVCKSFALQKFDGSASLGVCNSHLTCLLEDFDVKCLEKNYNYHRTWRVRSLVFWQKCFRRDEKDAFHVSKNLVKKIIMFLFVRIFSGSRTKKFRIFK